MTTVFVAGATGYIGRLLSETLVQRGHRVLALVRPGSRLRAPRGAELVEGDALKAETYQASIPTGSTFVQLIGVPHPSPLKGDAFRTVDLVAGLTSIEASRMARVSHFVYLSVAQPAPVMREFIEVRSRVESALRSSGIPSTILRPWYVIGPGHWWPALFVPVYRLLEIFPATRSSALRLGLVTQDQMIGSLVRAVENPPNDFRVWDVETIRGRSE